jgi:hypothetical protein
LDSVLNAALIDLVEQFPKGGDDVHDGVRRPEVNCSRTCASNPDDVSQRRFRGGSADHTGTRHRRDHGSGRSQRPCCDVVTATYWGAPPATLIAPTISPVAGTYATERVVTITPANPARPCGTPSMVPIRRHSSPLYVRAFAIAQTVTIKARTYKAGFAPGPVASSAFTIALSPDLDVSYAVPAAG